MKHKIVCLLFSLLLLFSCFKPNMEKGVLNFQTSMNQNFSKSLSLDTCLVRDLIWRFTSFELSTGRIIEGAPDTLDWISVYSDTTVSRLSEFGFETELSSGTYRTIRLAMRNRNYWVLEWGDSLLEVEDWNRDSVHNLAEDTPYSYYDFRGCWYCDNGEFENVAPDESISDIMISEGGSVDITMNWNMYKLVLDIDTIQAKVSILDWLIRESYDMIEWDIDYP